MAGQKKIEVKGNYLYITDVDTSIVEQRLPVSSTYYSLETKENITNTFVVFHVLGGFSDLVRTSAYGVWINNTSSTPLFTDGTTDYTLASLITFLDSNTVSSSINAIDSDIVASGSATSSTPFVVNLSGKGTYTFNASGTWVGSVIVEGSLDGTTWIPTTFVALASGNASSTFSAPTSGQVNTVGLDYIRFRSNTISSGSVVITGLASRLVSNVMLDNALPTGSNTIGNVGQSGTWTYIPRANTTGATGTIPYKLISLATTNANIVKASAGNLYSVIAMGLTSTVRYLKIYNKASAPTVGTDTPVMTIPIPANTQGAGVAHPFTIGVNFPLGIAIAITSGAADSDTGAVGAGDVILNLTYA